MDLSVILFILTQAKELDDSISFDTNLKIELRSTFQHDDHRVEKLDQLFRLISVDRYLLEKLRTGPDTVQCSQPASQQTIALTKISFCYILFKLCFEWRTKLIRWNRIEDGWNQSLIHNEDSLWVRLVSSLNSQRSML